MKVGVRVLGGALLVALLAPVPARAMLIGAGPFDRLIAGAKVIVKARVVSIGRPREWQMSTFQIEVLAVLKQDAGSIPRRIRVNVAEFIWPSDLDHPFKVGAVGLFVLERYDGGVRSEGGKGTLNVANNTRAILPAVEGLVEQPKEERVEAKVFAELAAFLPRMTTEAAKATMLVLLSNVSTVADEAFFAKYGEADSEVIRRGARAALLRVNPTAERVEEVKQDFVSHLAAAATHSWYKKPVTSSDDKDYIADHAFWGPYEDLAEAARCGAYGITKRCLAYLPIYRTICDRAPEGYPWATVVVEPLRDIGDREDILRLYKFVNHERAYVRAEALDGLCRILRINMRMPAVMSWGLPLAPEVLEQEKRMQEAVRAALREQGLLPK